jgi:peroxiredoxin/predicted 2-oxoglutarate/Fe(II)-dependent dioxygenase YbiX
VDGDILRMRLEIGDRLGEIGMFDERGEPVVFRVGHYVGRAVILFLCNDLSAPQAKRHVAALQAIAAEVERLDGCLCAISPRTPAEHLPVAKAMGVTFPFLTDPSGKIQQVLGLPGGGAPVTVILDSNHRLLYRVGPAEIADHAGEALARLKTYQESDRPDTVETQAPVLLMPRVLPPDLCASLIARWEREPHQKNMVSDYHALTSIEAADSKIRDDFFLPAGDPDTNRVRELLTQRLFPEVRRVFQYTITHSEQLRIGGYDAKDGGWFKRHDDNTHRRTSHRRFAMSLNLNTGEFDGGEVIFPEFGPKRYLAPTGAAMVFSCSLIHEALPVTRGIRMGMFTFFFGAAEEAYRLALAEETKRRAEEKF